MSKTMQQVLDQIHAEERLTQDATRQEQIELLGLIANDVMTGKTTVLHGSVLLDLRHSLMSEAERERDYKQTAADLGRLGGASKSPAKQRSSRLNGKLGGRPARHYELQGSGYTPDADDEERLARAISKLGSTAGAEAIEEELYRLMREECEGVEDRLSVVEVE